jgi:preprotein translocase SecE subunit
VARDRQRSKARKRRAGGQEPRGKRTRAEDIGLDDATVDESGLTDTAPAPDPLKNASAEVDQARAAETGVARGPAGDEIDVEQPDAYDEDFEHGADELETPSDLTTTGGGGRRGGLGEVAEGHPEPRDRGRVLNFLRACVEELRRVQWPDRKHVFQATAVVLVFCLIAGLYLGAMDALFQPLVEAII